MNKLASALQDFAENAELLEIEGNAKTRVPGVHYFRNSKGSPRQPLVYQSGIIIVAQGHKIIHFPERQIQYGAGDYLVLGMPMPLECEAFSDQGMPIMGLAIDVNPVILHKLVSQMQQYQRFTQGSPCHDKSCIQSAKLGAPLKKALERLISVLADPVEAEVFGQDIIKELIYHVLCGPQGHILFGLAQHDGHYARVARALNTMHANFASPITIEALAEDANMSVSAFHRAFRQVTFESPLQYLKKVRLVKARDLIATNGSRANEAAFKVGYTSASQFSREFKRHFNKTPSEMSIQH
jgi:AraC-like DNA-binding protein